MEWIATCPECGYRPGFHAPDCRMRTAEGTIDRICDMYATKQITMEQMEVMIGVVLRREQ